MPQIDIWINQEEAKGSNRYSTKGNSSETGVGAPCVKFNTILTLADAYAIQDKRLLNLI